MYRRLLICLLFPALCSGQQADCVKINNIPFNKRLQNYPFSQATKVLAVSYLADTNSYGQLLRKIDYRLPVKNDTICYSKLHELITLTASQINILTDILYNYGEKYKTSIGLITMCYRPRKALIFVNEKEESFAWLEICFECEQTRSNNQKMNWDNLCFKQYDLLKTLFTQTGITYGVKTTLTNE